MYKPGTQIHFVGIGGVGMGGLAEILLTLGYAVSGSDMNESEMCEHLRGLGAHVRIGHSADAVTTSVRYVVVSSAIPETNVEVVAARERGLPVVARGEMLAELMRVKYGIAVAGSHGKTTTTSLVGAVLEAGLLEPTTIVGGRVLSKASGASHGGGDFLVAEADESDGSFMMLRPALSVITNIDNEHIGHYGSFGALESAFERFASSVPFYGASICCIDDPVVSRLAARLNRRVITYGFSPDADLRAHEAQSVDGKSICRVSLKGKELGMLRVPMPGKHMIQNALAAIAVGLELDMSPERCFAAIQDFSGVARRSEVLVREERLPTVIDDYGHHPVEIRATISAIRDSWVEAGDGRLLVVFQPHRYSRTKELFSDFLASFTRVDHVFMLPIYAASEQPIAGVTAEALSGALPDVASTYIADPSKLYEMLDKEIDERDTVLFLGAGDIGSLARGYAKQLTREFSTRA